MVRDQQHGTSLILGKKEAYIFSIPLDFKPFRCQIADTESPKISIFFELIKCEKLEFGVEVHRKNRFRTNLLQLTR